ncbi:uncharacterized protein L201_007662 [Kwoniella dendrophila CBS 6074]|uniref:Ribokinase n=1 Tax=Kwoniella dendrophila CBS 6074 TaxID=1295534 RepID=A0AAX4K6H7_9TREE
MASSSQSRCLVKGSINIDEFFALPHIVRPGETISSTSLTKTAGGKGANQSYAVSQASGKVDLDGYIGKDGEWVRDYLVNGGVGDKRLITLDEELTGRAIIQSSSDGENSIVLHAGANYYIPSSSSSSSSSDIPDLDGYSHILLQNEIPLSITRSYLIESNKKGLISIFNPSPMLSDQDLKQFPWKSLNWLIVNEVELNDLLIAFSTPSSTNQNSLQNQNNQNKIKILEDLELNELIEISSNNITTLNTNQYFSKEINIICTLGSKGILYFTPSSSSKDVKHLPASKLKNPLRDTTGAGDCFAGYFVAGLMRNEHLEDVLKTCLTACAICVENQGAMESIPSRDEVISRQKEQ